MALITCPDCGRELSDRAPACPGCARPMDAARPVVIEQTRKGYKKGMLVGLILTVLFFFATAAVPQEAVGMTMSFMLLGVVIFVISLIAAWWNHG